MTPNRLQQLERYTMTHPQEVLRLFVEYLGEEQEILIFRGVSSSLTHPTHYDPDVPLIGDDAQFIQVDRLQSPYDPTNPRYIEQGLTWDVMQQRL